MIEEWRQIPSFPNYEASSLGRVRCISGHHLTTDFLKGILKKRGYLCVSVHRDSKKFQQRVNALVCEAFHGPRPTPQHQAAHGDGVKTHNFPSNLRWATPVENAQDRVLHGTAPRGERNPAAILTPENVKEIRILHGAHMVGRDCVRRGFYTELADKFGVDRCTIREAALRMKWRHL